mmetsp:Transcript_101924/g.297227  ORF Transcript_101924/g.297227 Transcript_101924/m.297227 type:complete len:309 (-) Transcript_101924:333-1259(-)
MGPAICLPVQVEAPIVVARVQAQREVVARTAPSQDPRMAAARRVHVRHQGEGPGGGEVGGRTLRVELAAIARKLRLVGKDQARHRRRWGWGCRRRLRRSRRRRWGRGRRRRGGRGESAGAGGALLRWGLPVPWPTRVRSVDPAALARPRQRGGLALPLRGHRRVDGGEVAHVCLRGRTLREQPVLLCCVRGREDPQLALNVHGGGVLCLPGHLRLPDRLIMLRMQGRCRRVAARVAVARCSEALNPGADLCLKSPLEYVALAGLVGVDFDGGHPGVAPDTHVCNPRLRPGVHCGQAAPGVFPLLLRER